MRHGTQPGNTRARGLRFSVSMTDDTLRWRGGWARLGSWRGRADVAYLGVGQLGVQDEGYIRDYWTETVAAVGARRVVLTHWDDFFRPIDAGARMLPAMKLPRLVDGLTSIDRSVRIGTVPLMGSIRL